MTELNEIITHLQQQVSDCNTSSFYERLSVDNTLGCVEFTAECVIDHTNAGSATPSFATCETSLIPVSENGMSNVNVYCYVDNAITETNPLVATLNIYDNAITCICSIVAISQPSGSPVCKLHVRRCPNSSIIRVNSTT